ncbi:MAG: 16S rRNA methyltransferase [Candidatus Bathyarchaeota archaeon]
MLNLIFAESALETIPESLWNHPSIINRAKALGKNPKDTLLDRSYHHRAMLQLIDGEKRGRPDIIHFALLEALGTPLNREGLLRIYIHTVSDHIISIDPEVRLPRNYDRFVGLVGQLYKEGKVPVTGRPLLTVRKGFLNDVLLEIKPSYVLMFSRKGKAKTLGDAVEVLSEKNNSLAIIGAFPHGNFSDETVKLADMSVSIDPEMLEAWTVTSRVIYEFEKHIGLPEIRWKKEQ